VSTKDIYEALPRRLTKTKFDVKLLSHALRNADLQMMEKTLFNRLEQVTFKKHKLLKGIKQKISALGVRAVLMSGSGSAIFGLVENKKKAIHVKKKLQGIYKVMVVRSL
jgi:4-diphosphocytidyl-2-C-methyl-D-erythritol kinase